MVLREADLEFDFSSAIEAIHYYDDSLHGKCTMKRVDFIAEYEDHYVFLEVKDPDNPAAKNQEAFKNKLLGGSLIPDLAGKYRDSFWFRSLSKKADKPIFYVVLLSMNSLDPALLLNKQDELQRSLPLRHRNWEGPCAHACIILNLNQYKKQYSNDAVRRVSTGA